MRREVFVTEVASLHTTVVRGIHSVTREGDFVRIFTYDKKPHPGGVEHQVNGDFIMTAADLKVMLREVYESALTGPDAAFHREVLEGLGCRKH